MKRHEKSEKGLMGVAVIVVLGIFFGLHLMLPQIKLWPMALISLVVVTMLASHFHKGSHRRHHPVVGSSEAKR